MVTLTPLNSVLDRMVSLSRAMDAAVEGAYENGTNTRPVWFPALDSYETENTFVIEVDIPGVHLENVDINFEQNTLTIKGVRGPTIRAEEKKELRVFTSERVAGAFARSIRLPDYVDGEKIEAAYANGVLTVTVPKAAAAMPRKITVKAAESR